MESEHTPSKALHEWSTPWLSNAQWVENYPQFFNALLSLKGEKFSNREELDRLIFDKLDKAIFSKFKSQLKWADKEAQDLLLGIYLWFAELMQLSLAETADNTLEELPTPNPPLIPALRGVKLSYRAETVI